MFYTVSDAAYTTIGFSKRNRSVCIFCRTLVGTIARPVRDAHTICSNTPLNELYNVICQNACAVTIDN